MAVRIVVRAGADSGPDSLGQGAAFQGLVPVKPSQHNGLPWLRNGRGRRLRQVCGGLFGLAGAVRIAGQGADGPRAVDVFAINDLRILAVQLALPLLDQT